MKNITATGLLGLIAALVISTSLPSPLFAAELRLLPRIVVHGNSVTLADIFEDVGDVGETIVSPAPLPGKRLAIAAARLYRAVQNQGLVWSPPHGIRSIIVRRAGYRIPASEIEAAILDALADESGGGNLSIRTANRNKAIYVASDVDAALKAENLSYDPETGRFEISLIAAAGTKDELRFEFRGRAIEVIKLPVLNKVMKKGAIIGDGDIEWLEQQADRVPGDVITNSAALVGLAARYSLGAGRPMRASDVREPIVVARGSAVSLVYRTPYMVLTAGGEALEDGAMGSVIRVLNRKSKIIVEARVDGGNVLSVAGGVTSLAMNEASR